MVVLGGIERMMRILMVQSTQAQAKASRREKAETEAAKERKRKEGGSHGEQMFPDVDVRRRHLSFSFSFEEFSQGTIPKVNNNHPDAHLLIVTLIGTHSNYRIQDRSRIIS